MKTYAELVAEYRKRQRDTVVDTLAAGLTYVDEIAVETGLLEEAGILAETMDQVTGVLPFVLITASEGTKVLLLADLHQKKFGKDYSFLLDSVRAASPDIIILDEVLSVGDGSFRQKSGDKMREILASGVTGVLVSHSIDQVRELCNKVLWLHKGRQIVFSDDVDGVCDAYEKFLETGGIDMPGYSREEEE